MPPECEGSVSIKTGWRLHFREARVIRGFDLVPVIDWIGFANPNRHIDFVAA
jgi:hypothetical protein